MSNNGRAVEVPSERDMLTKIAGAMPMPTGAQEAGENIKRLVEETAARVQRAGRYARDHGQYLDEVSTAFAKQLLADYATFASNVMAAEGRKTAELEKHLGTARREVRESSVKS